MVHLAVLIKLIVPTSPWEVLLPQKVQTPPQPALAPRAHVVSVLWTCFFPVFPVLGYQPMPK